MAADKQLRMLAVDDDKDMRSSLAVQFEAEGFVVDTAGDGIPALSLIQQQRYDIILLDLHLPRMGGLALMKELHIRGTIPNIIILTASNSLLKAVECVNLGAKNYLLKPYDPEELLALVRKTVIKATS
ncbi:MAG TPA: response regulator [Bacteroidota bacterium]|jgi:DNA-binding response OmpR family regulator|nr:response regulator [Bacteroidota bacterium]